ncbi:hypothetical protein [Gottfriedia acidiceleris]|nr:hypothetical protein [Gottfriedia acidiceleris]
MNNSFERVAAKVWKKDSNYFYATLDFENDNRYHLSIANINTAVVIFDQF